jgi:hypothetical protein
MVSFTPRPFTHGETAPGTRCVGDRVDPRAGLSAVDKINISSLFLGVEPRFLGRPALSLVPIPPELGGYPAIIPSCEFSYYWGLQHSAVRRSV